MSKANGKLNIYGKLLVLLLAVTVVGSLACFSAFAAENVTEGACGKELSWSYKNGTLTITGKGEMQNFTELEKAPWYHLRDEISRVVLPNGLTSVGDLAFYQCGRLTSVTLPEKVIRIGHYAFAGCKKMTTIDIGAALRSIGNAAFYECESLDAIRLPYGLESIGYEAFFKCSSLSAITLPKKLSQIGSSAFAYCTGLVKAEILSNINILPEWTFYGCDLLAVVVLPETVTEIDNYALKNCDGLYTVYYDGGDAQKDQLKKEISKDLPEFEHFGYVGKDEGLANITSSRSTEKDDGTVITENIVIRQDSKVTIVSSTKNTYEADSGKTRSDGEVKIVVEKDAEWSNVSNELSIALKDMSDNSLGVNENTIVINVYLKDGETLDNDFIESLAGRDVKIIVNLSDGSEWRINCRDVKKSEDAYDYSHSLSEPTETIIRQLKTDNCYGLNFTTSSNGKAETVVTLPSGTAYNNAFLYQVEKDGSYTVLQSVKVDGEGKAHFYLASVDKNTEYVIGVNVPGESTETIIYPDELLSAEQRILNRVENIEYVTTGINSSWGLTGSQVTWIMVGVIVGCIVLVGVIMTVINKKRLKAKYSA